MALHHAAGRKGHVPDEGRLDDHVLDRHLPQRAVRRLPGMRMKTSIWSRLRTDQRGASAVEFAMIAPLMLMFYFGLTELCQAMLAERRVSHVASAVGDLVTQTDKLTPADLPDIIALGGT